MLCFTKLFGILRRYYFILFFKQESCVYHRHAYTIFSVNLVCILKKLEYSSINCYCKLNIVIQY